jgi:hypothetical protein
VYKRQMLAVLLLTHYQSLLHLTQYGQISSQRPDCQLWAMTLSLRLVPRLLTELWPNYSKIVVFT